MNKIMRSIALLSSIFISAVATAQPTQPQFSLDATSKTLSIRNPAVAGPAPIGVLSGNSINLIPGKVKAGAIGWLEAMIPATEALSTVQGISTIGGVGTLGACRTSDGQPAGSMGCQGISGFSINDDTVNIKYGYGGYFEARRKAGALGSEQGVEANVLNGGSLVDEDPYNFNTIGLTEGARVTCGRTDTTLNNPCTVGFVLAPNGAVFRRGFMCVNGSLDTVLGGNRCLEMASGHRISWYRSTGGIGAEVYGGAGGTPAAGELHLLARNTDGVPVDVSLMGFGNNTLAASGLIDLGTEIKPWNIVHARGVATVSRAPSSSTSSCSVGDQTWDANYTYVCIATNSWKRAALVAF